MTSKHDLNTAAAALQRAVVEGRYVDARGLLADYASVIAELRNPEAVAEACWLLEWARKLTLGRKATAAARLTVLPAAARRYGEIRLKGAHTWDVTG